MLDRRGRVSRTALALEFDLSDGTLAALCDELVSVLEVADVDGDVLVARRTHATAPAPATPIALLLCDLVESVAVDALDTRRRELIGGRFQAICAEVAGRQHGRRQPWVADGSAIVFDEPGAVAVRAVRCGWEIQATLAAARPLLEREFGVALHARIGIATVAGDAVATAPDDAAAVQRHAAPDRVAVDRRTRELAGEQFEFEPAGELFVLRAPHDAERHDHATTPLVGRLAERALLRALARRAASGTRSAVLIRGEPGIGKSRLVADLRATTAELELQAVVCRCVAQRGASPLRPLLDGLRGLWELDGPHASARLATRARCAGDDRTLALLAGMLGVAPPDGVGPQQAMSPARLRRERIGALAAALTGEARRRPLLVVVEDLHWADATTLELLGVLLDAPRELALLLVMTARGDFEPPSAVGLQRLDLARLQPAETRQLVERVADGAVLDGAIATDIAARAAGSPLLAEELTRTMLSAAGGGVPYTLLRAVTTRLGRDATARSVAQLAATAGPEVNVALLRALDVIDAAQLDWGLDWLAREALLAPAGAGVYEFRHDLVRDAARSSLAANALRAYNLRAARTLLERFPHVAEAEPERVARHLELGGELAAATAHWRRAGVQALHAGAVDEASDCLTRALGLTARLADGDERHATELGLRVLAGRAVALRDGWQSPAAVAHVARADALTVLATASPRLLRAQLELTAQRLIAGRVDDALTLARAQVKLATAAGSDDLLLEVECELGWALVHAGRHRDALAHLDRVGELYDANRDGDHAVRFGRHPAAIALAARAIALACRDDRDAARQAIAASAALLRAERHPFSQAWVHCAAATAALLCGAREVVEREAELALRVSRAEGFDDWFGLASVLHGWARARGGDRSAGVDELRAGIAAWTQTGIVIGRSFVFGLLAEVLIDDGPPARAHDALDEALRWVGGGERWYEPELQRLRAELLLAGGDRAAAGEHAHSAATLAKRHGATTFARRAAATLERASGRSAAA